MGNGNLLAATVLAAILLGVPLLSACGGQQDVRPSYSTASESISVDEAIRELVESNAFKNADVEGRAALAEALLEEYSRIGAVSNVSYDSGNSLYSFEYPDGSAGGIYLKDFGVEEN